MHKCRGFLLISLMMFLGLGAVVLAGVFFTDIHFDVMKNRAELMQRFVNEVTSLVLRQGSIYGARRNLFYLAETDSEKNVVKNTAVSRWFDRFSIENEKAYSYEELKEKFGASNFENVDAVLNLSTLKMKNITFSVPLRIRKQIYENTTQIDQFGRMTVGGAIEQEFSSVVFDKNDFVLNCSVLIDIELDDGYRLPSMLNGRTRGRNGAVTMWRLNGATVTIPVMIGGKNSGIFQ